MRGRDADPGKKLADVQRRRKKRYTRSGGERARKKFPLLWPRRRLQPSAACVFLFFRFLRSRYPSAAAPSSYSSSFAAASASSSFSPVSPPGQEGMRKDRDARMCQQGHSIDFSASRGSHGEASPVCRAAALSRRITIRATQNSLATVRSSPPDSRFKVNPLTVARHLRRTPVGWLGPELVPATLFFLSHSPLRTHTFSFSLFCAPIVRRGYASDEDSFPKELWTTR